MIKTLLKTHLLILLGVAAGAIGGLLYRKFTGCASGTCPVSSSPVNMALWGALTRGLLLNVFKKDGK